MLRIAVLGPCVVALALALATLAATVSGATHSTRDFVFDPDQVEIVPQGEQVEVRYPGAQALARAGEVDLPSTLHWIAVPEGFQVADLAVEEIQTADLGPQVPGVAPEPHRAGDPEPAVAPATSLRARHGLQPDAWAEVAYQGSLRGRRVAVLRIHPLRWDPESGRLLVARRLRLGYELVADPGAVSLPRHRVVPAYERRVDAALRKVVPDLPAAAVSHDGGGAGANPLDSSGPAGDGPYQPTFRPSLDGSPVEYVIVTNEALRPEFERLAAWKNAKGVQAVVRTTEWIDQTYPNGVDLAERIRFFIRDAYQNWGTVFVALGGDTDVIPVRYATTTAPLAEIIPADMYYTCLEGNWNGDGDDRFAEGVHNGAGGEQEPGDDADLLFEVSVGRFPASTLAEAQTCVDKLLEYEITPPSDLGYPASILALAERLFTASHGADKAELALAHVYPWFKVSRLYEESQSYPGSEELTAATAIDSINVGYGMVLHVGHGYRNTMSVGDGTINNGDVDNLTNGPRNSVVFAINCSSASIDFNSIGERWLKNPNGGAVTYLGTSRLAYVTPSTIYLDAWFGLVFDDSVSTIGLATEMARAALAVNASFDGATRWNLTATTLLGDPELGIYRATLAPLEVAHAPSFELGDGSLTVTVTSISLPVAGATVTLEKQGEAYATGTTDAGGGITLPFTPETAGDALFTVRKSYYSVQQDTLPVIDTSNPYPFILQATIDDDDQGLSSGDGDGLADAGETIELTLTLRNGGGAAATGVTGTLSATDPEAVITLVADQVSYGTIGAGGAAGGSSAYVLTIDPGAPVAYQPVLDLAINANEGNWSDVSLLPIRRPNLEHYGHTIDDALPRGNGNGVVEAGEEIWYSIALRNTGQHELPAVQATLHALDLNLQPNPLVTVLDSTSSFAAIPVDSVVTGDRFEFLLDGAVNPNEVLLEVSFGSPPYAELVQLLDVVQPGLADSIRAFGAPTAITLKWEPPADADVLGYDVYRSINPFGTYTRINEFVIEGSASYEDAGLPPLSRFYYEVVTRDTSFNSSSASAIISGTTNPPLHSGWPLEVAQQSSSSPTVVDLDGDWQMEILVGAEMQYALHFDGTEVVDGDGDPRTNGPFALEGRSVSEKGFGATQAVGDMDDDGSLEVANVGWVSDSLFVWDRLGNLFPGFPKSVLDDFNWPSPVLADLDLDGDLEVVVWAAKGGRLFAWHHTGIEVVDGDQNPFTDGIMMRIFGTSFCYGSPAVGNLDADPELEIIVPVNISDDDSGAVYALNIDGSAVDGWPFFTGEPGFPSQVSSSPVVADLDSDGDAEVIVVAERDGGEVYVIHHNGVVDPNWPVPAAAVTPDSRLPSVAVADLDGDSFLDIVYPATDGMLHAWDRFGTPLTGFPTQFADIPTQATQCTPAVGDVDGDDQLEILFGDETGKLHGFNHDGTEVDGFPIQTGGEVRGTPAIWDIDGDNLVEVSVMSFDGNIYFWDLPFDFNPTLTPWPMFRHDTRNTGAISVPVLPVGIAEPAGAPSGLPRRPALYAAVPNPFNPRTRIAFDVPGESGGARWVHLAIYDVQGRQVRGLVDGLIEAGSYTAIWDGVTDHGGAASSGVYFAQLRTGDFVGTRKLVMLR